MSKMKKIIACIASMAVAVVTLASFTSVVSADILVLEGLKLHLNELSLQYTERIKILTEV